MTATQRFYDKNAFCDFRDIKTYASIGSGPLLEGAALEGKNTQRTSKHLK